jgi:clan AA aspartic protease
MNGHVDAAGRALFDVRITSALVAESITLSAWIDTGFTGDLVLPQAIIDDLALPQSGTVGAVLADGSQVIMQAYRCFILWFENFRRLEVVPNDGTFPFLGVGLLLDHDLRIDYLSKSIELK